MHAELIWDGQMGFTGTGDSGHAAKMDVATEVGGLDTGARPTELLLFALGGCSGADVVSIIKKMQMHLEKLTITVSGTRAAEHPKRFTGIHIIYRFTGADIDPAKAKHAIELSQTKYCSVAATLNADITYEMILESQNTDQ